MSALYPRTCNALDEWPWVTYDVGISLRDVVVQRAEMCGMWVCEWTQQELTLNIRFMGGDYDPGHSGRNREKDSKAKANGRDEV